MKLLEILAIAAANYPDLGMHWREWQGGIFPVDYGDTLALFIVREIVDDYDPDEGLMNLSLAAARMRTAVNEITKVAEALELAEELALIAEAERGP